MPKRILCVLTLASLLVQSNEAPAVASEPVVTIATLLPILGDPSREARDLATTAIIALGPSVLPLVDEASRDATGEEAHRLRFIRQELEREAIEQSLDIAGLLRAEAVRVEPIIARSSSETIAFRIVLRVAWEPRLEPIVLRLPLASVVAETTDGESVAPRQPAAVIEATTIPGRAWAEMPIVLAAPTATVDRLRRLACTVEVWLPAAKVPVRFPWPHEGSAKTHRSGEVLVTCESTSLTGTRLRTVLSAEYPPSEALASHRQWIASFPIEATAGAGPLPTTSQRILRRSERGIAREAEFSLPIDHVEVSHDGDSRAEVIWRLPLAVRHTKIDFDLEEVLLPPNEGATRPRAAR